MSQRSHHTFGVIRQTNNFILVNGKIQKNKLQSISLIASYEIKYILGEKYDHICIPAGLHQSFLGLDSEFHLLNWHIS